MGKLISLFSTWLVKTVLIKFVSFTILYVVVSAFASYLLSKLTMITPNQLLSQLSAWTPQMWYFADLTMFQQGIPAVISAYILRFSIRRIPLIG